MQHFNRIIVIGNVGTKPELRFTKTKLPVLNFRLAISHSEWDKSADILVEETEWFQITIWDKQAEIAYENIKQGSKILIEGKFKTKNLHTASGEIRTLNEIISDKFIIL